MNSDDRNDDNFESQGDDFGLPDVNYTPLDQDAPSQSGYYDDPPDPQHDSQYTLEDDTPSRSPLIIGLMVVILLLGGGGAWYYFYVFKPEKEKEKQEEIARQKREAKQREQEKLAQLEREKEEMRMKEIADSVARVEAAATKNRTVRGGKVQVLDQRTDRYHVVISSALDDDLLADYAKALRRRGVDTKMIAPYGSVRFHRLTIFDDYDTFDRAQQKANEISGNYPNGAWVLKY